MEKYCMGQWRPNLEPNMKSYLAWTPSPFVSSDWTITKETLLTCEQTSYSFFPLTGSHFLQLVCPPRTNPSALLSLVVYLVQGGLGCLPRRAVLLQSYLLTIIDSEELGEKEREQGKCILGELEWPRWWVQTSLDCCLFPKRVVSPSSSRDVILGSKDY